MHRIEINVITGEMREVQLTPDEIAAMETSAPEAVPLVVEPAAPMQEGASE